MYIKEGIMKYKNKKTTIDGITFASMKEAKRYQELKLLERAGVIKDLELQKEFELQPSYKKNGRTVRKISYIADFCYYENGKYVVEDTKGCKTQVYKLKKKIFEYRYDYEIRET